MSKPTREEIGRNVAFIRRNGAWNDDTAVIVALADDIEQYEATLQAMTESHTECARQRDELLALLRRMVKYVREDRAVTPRTTRLARLTDETDRLLLGKYKGTP